LKRHAEDWILARAWPELARIDIIYEGQMNPDTLHVPRKKVRIGFDEIRNGKKWDRLFAKPQQLQSLLVNVCVDDGAPIGGVTIQRAIQDEVPTGEGTVHLGIWVRSAGDNSSTDIERDRTQFTSLMDSLFSSLPGLQAWTANWDWVPRFTMAEENNYTPYEDATSIYLIRQRPCINLETAWCGRYLRAVSQQMWLSRTLLQYVDRDSLRGMVNETPLDNDSIRIDLLPNCHPTHLEDVLSPVIPSPEMIQT
jgi:hypothetical protein